MKAHNDGQGNVPRPSKSLTSRKTAKRTGCLALFVLLLALVVYMVNGMHWYAANRAKDDFLMMECEAGRMPRDTEEFLRVAGPRIASSVNDDWSTFHTHAKVVEGNGVRKLVGHGWFLWSFRFERTLEPYCGGGRPEP